MGVLLADIEFYPEAVWIPTKKNCIKKTALIQFTEFI